MDLYGSKIDFDKEKELNKLSKIICEDKPTSKLEKPKAVGFLNQSISVQIGRNYKTNKGVLNKWYSVTALNEDKNNGNKIQYSIIEKGINEGTKGNTPNKKWYASSLVDPKSRAKNLKREVGRQFKIGKGQGKLGLYVE